MQTSAPTEGWRSSVRQPKPRSQRRSTTTDGRLSTRSGKMPRQGVEPADPSRSTAPLLPSHLWRSSGSSVKIISGGASGHTCASLLRGAPTTLRRRLPAPSLVVGTAPTADPASDPYTGRVAPKPPRRTIHPTPGHSAPWAPLQHPGFYDRAATDPTTGTEYHHGRH